MSVNSTYKKGAGEWYNNRARYGRRAAIAILSFTLGQVFYNYLHTVSTLWVAIIDPDRYPLPRRDPLCNPYEGCLSWYVLKSTESKMRISLQLELIKQ